MSGLTYGTPSISHGRVFVATLGRRRLRVPHDHGRAALEQERPRPRARPHARLGEHPLLLDARRTDVRRRRDERPQRVAVRRAASTRPGSAPRAATTSRSTGCSSPSAGRTAPSRERFAARLGRARRARRGGHAQRRHPRLRPLAVPARRRVTRTGCSDRSSARPTASGTSACCARWPCSPACSSSRSPSGPRSGACRGRWRWRRPSSSARRCCLPAVALQVGLRQATAPWFFTNDSTYQLELAGELVRDGHTPYGADYGSSGLERFYSLNGSTAQPESHAALRHFAYFPGAALMAAAWGVLPGPFDDVRWLVALAVARAPAGGAALPRAAAREARARRAAGCEPDRRARGVVRHCRRADAAAARARVRARAPTQRRAGRASRSARRS